MKLHLIEVLLPIVFFAVNTATQVVSRAVLKAGMLRSEAAGFVTGLCGIVAAGLINLSVLSPSQPLLTGEFTANLIIYICLSYCYFHFINLAVTARRIRLLRELYFSGNGLTMEEILSRYSAKDMIEKRICRLLNTGQIVNINGRYITGKPVMYLIVKVILLMKLFVLGKKSEFD